MTLENIKTLCCRVGLHWRTDVPALNQRWCNWCGQGEEVDEWFPGAMGTLDKTWKIIQPGKHAKNKK